MRCTGLKTDEEVWIVQSENAGYRMRLDPGHGRQGGAIS
jgi:hypothetical protein